MFGDPGEFIESGYNECTGKFEKIDTLEFNDFTSLDHLRIIGNVFLEEDGWRKIYREYDTQYIACEN